MIEENSNPYVGLRPFDVSESILFFGRNEQIIQLLQRLHQHRFLAVVGSSGCGKSSLLRAGLIPALKAGFLVADSDHWHISVMKPGQDPLRNLSESILNQLNENTDPVQVQLFMNQILEEGVSVIIDLLKPLRETRKVNFFLLIDQFEELFRFAMSQNDMSKRDEAIEFVNIMLELSQQTEVPVYVLVTMRSDFIGDCAQFYGLPEAMNQSQYLVPRLNRVQLKAVIEGPARLYGGKLDPYLTSKLLNELGKVQDELPLLQHALMRMWEFETTVNKSGAIDLEDYQSIGGIEKALSNHAQEALTGMTDEERMIASKIFKALTTIDINGRRIRRPVMLSELKLLTGASEIQLLHIIGLFIQNRRSLLIVSNVGNGDDKIIDISHESLIRQWNTLETWVEEEGEAAAVYFRLAGATKLYKQNKKDLLTGSELQKALEWRNTVRPTPTWANRYYPGFEDCIDYLKASEVERTRLLNREAARERRQTILIFTIMGMLLVGLVGGWWLWSKADNAARDAQAAVDQSKKLIDNFYFYEDKWALAFDGEHFGFMDKNGEYVDLLGKWKNAEQFNDFGLARVVDEQDNACLLDTDGNYYRVVYALNDDVDLNAQALDLTDSGFDELPEKVFEFRDLKCLILSNNSISELPQRITELKQLKYLVLEGNTMEMLPEEIASLSELKALVLSYNHFTGVPDGVFELGNLKTLKLEGNQLEEISPKIGQLQNLINLNLSVNELKSIPEELCQLKNLKYLALSDNNISSIPDNIGELESLARFDLEGNPLHSIPKGIGRLQYLTNLNLASDALKEIPSEIGDLKNLKSIDLSNNELSALPEEIGNLEKLEFLSLSSNKLSELPDQLWQLSELTALDMSANSLKSVSDQIGYLSRLRELFLNDNQISSLPDEIGRLKRLLQLNVSNNALSGLTKDIGDLENLNLFDASLNPITLVPSEVGKLKHLKTLNLSGCNITSLPDQMGELHNLISLDISCNEVSAMPESLSRLSNLRNLNANGNHFIKVPDVIFKLKGLEVLNLRKCEITAIPDELGQLTRLSTLDLGVNKISRIPAEIGELKSLNYLKLDSNQLHELPEEMNLLRNVYVLKLKGNPISSKKDEWRNLGLGKMP